MFHIILHRMLRYFQFKSAKFNQVSLACFLLFLLTACLNHNISPSTPPTSGTTTVNNIGINPTVYIGGNFGASAIIWKNGIADTIDRGDIRSIFVDGADVYAAGWKWFNYNSVGRTKEAATYWKNGVPVVLSDTSKQIYPQSIFVSDNHVYVVGFEWARRPIARYWKDGIPITLTNPDTTSWTAATGIYVSGADVYIAGLSNVSSKYPRATYWKNGEPVYLADGSIESVAKSIFVSGNDVYVAGTLNWDEINSNLLNPESSFLFGTESKCIATYWKNGKAMPLSTVGSYASSIFVNGTDVYVTGAIGSTLVGRSLHLVSLTQMLQHSGKTECKLI